MKKLTNFFNCAAKAAQKTGGGNSQLPLRSEGAQRCETRGVNHAIITQLSPNNHPITLRAIRYVAVLLMVFMVGIGQMWGADLQYFSSITASSTKNSFAISNVSAATSAGGTATFTMATGTSGAAKYYVNMVPQSTNNLKLQLFNGINENFEDTIYLCVTVNADTYLSFCRGSNSNYAVIGKKNNSTNVFSYESNDAMAKETGSYQFKSGYTYYIKSSTTTGNSVNEVRVYHRDASTTVTITACLVEGHPAAGSAATTYTVTVNPNGGSTSTAGWTLTSGNYVKSGIAKDASVTLPTMTKDNYTFAGWKDNHDNAITSPITITKDTTLVAQWTSSAATQYNISYTNTKGATNSNPAKYTEGVGVASFEPLSDVTDFHFTGWNPASISTTATGAQTIEAQWVAAYDVTFSAGAGSGTAPDGFQKWEGAKFNLPGQGSMTAPAGKVFDGWKANGAGDKLAADAEYTMGGAEVEFVAQWKAVPQTIFDWTFANNSDISSDKTDLSNATYGTMTTGTSILGRIFGSTSIAKNSSGYKLQSADACFEIQGTYDFMEGDTIKISVKGGGSGERGLAITPSSASSVTEGALVTSMVDGSVNGVCTAILTSTEEGAKIRVFQYNGKNMYVKNIKVIRPAAKEVVSTVNTLTDVKVNGTSISDANLASLVSEHNLALSDGAAAAPTITFNKHTVITYDDNSNKVTDTPIEVTATVVEGKWSANTTIEDVTYTVTLVKLVSYEVTYAAGDGEGTMTDSNSPYIAGAEVTLLANAFTAPNGKEFDAWVVTKTNGGASVTVTDGKFIMPAEAVTVTANWKDITYAVTYHANGATGPVPAVADYAANAKVIVAGKGDLARTIDTEAATFYGWNTKVDMSGTRYEAGAEFNMPAADVDLYAVWGFAINYNPDGGTINGTYPTWYVSDGATTSILTQLPTNVTREGYEFGGWYAHNGAGDKLTAINAGYYGNFEGEWALKAKWILSAPIGKAQSIDMEGLVESDGTSAEWQNYLYSHGYSFSTDNVSLDEKKDPSEDKAYDNWPYQGLKMKKSGAYVQGTVEADKLVIIKLGHMAAAATVTIGGTAQANATGLDAAEPAGQLNYYYVENESVLRYETTNDGACVLKAITITDPYTVSFAAHGDADPAALDGHPAVTLPTPTNGTASFLGWFTAETGGAKIGDAGASYIPTADIELHAQWEAISTDNTLSDLKVGGVTVDGFSPTVHTYYVVLPYGTAVGDIPVISATANSAKAKQVAIQQAVWTGDPYNCYRAQANVQAEDESWGYYDVRFSFAPKDGVSIIKATYAGGNQSTGFDADGLYAGKGYANLASSKKMDTNNFAGVELKSGETFKTGDVLFVNLVEAATSAGLIELYEEASGTNLIWATGVNDASAGLELPAAVNGKSAIYVVRKASNGEQSWNAKVNYIEVTRPMNPMLTAITIDGRDGEIDEANKTVEVTIPYEAELDALTIVPTIVRNAAHATTPEVVTSNGGAWVLEETGDNTYRIMDKDGDYTDYTITLSRDVLKHTVSFNAESGSAVASELVVDGEHLTAAPAAPTREDYEFQGWAETANGEVVDVTSFAITADKEFHAIWLYENPIKLIKDNGDVNTEDFLTTVSKGTVSFGNADHNCASFGSTAQTVVGASGLNKYIIYNAKTDKTKIKFVLYNTQNSAQTIKLQKLVEGGTEMEEVLIEVPSKQEFATDYYAFNSADNRTMYVCTQNTGIKVLQVKVVDNGAPVKQFGENGYSINFNQGRLFFASGVNTTFDGMTYKANSNYAPLSNAAIQITKNASYSFTVSAPVTMTVTAANNSKYYITTTENGTENETAVAEARPFDLTAGTWYLRVDNGGLNLTSIEFSDPRPVYTRENLNPNNIGTLCVQYTGRLEGATLYELAGKNEHNYLVFDEVENNAIQPGYPYIFVPENGNTKVEVYKTNEETVDAPVDLDNGMMGTFVDLSSADGENSLLWNKYIISKNHYIYVDSDNVTLKKYRAYITSLDDVAPANQEPAPTQNGAPRRRLVMGGNAPAVATDVDNIYGNDTKVQKILINGQLFIIRGEKMYDATGRFVK